MLFGFFEPGERALFRALIKTNGVGPKLGLAILSGIEAQDFVRVVRTSDVAALERLPGIGKKTAERLIIEMRDRLQDWQERHAGGSTEAASLPGDRRQALDEAESALVALGYKPREANRAIKNIAREEMTSQDLIRQALKVMVKV